MRCLFASDLHGFEDRYRKLLQSMETEAPHVVLLGGDLLPSGFSLAGRSREGGPDFLDAFLIPRLEAVRERMGDGYPALLLIPGNDDPRAEEESFRNGEARGLWRDLHGRCTEVGGHPIFGYACVPPTPFLLKDWERYDVSRYVSPGCVSPEEGWRSVDVSAHDIRYGTIKADLESLTEGRDLASAIFLFHTPPADTTLDRAALDGKMVDHVPLDLHVGSIAVRRFIEVRQPLLTLHGHIHESARITGAWRDRLGRSHLFTGAHDGPELALVRFDTEDLEAASRELL